MSRSPTTTPVASSPPGSKVMSVGLSPPSQKCVCGRDACRKLSQLFGSLDGDVRSGFFQLPASVPQRNGAIKAFRLQRIIDHMNLTSDDGDFSSQDDRNRSAAAPASPSTTRSGKKKKRKITYVARHHYHPEVLQEYIINANETSSIDYIHEEFVRDAKLLGNGYSEEDRFIGQVSGREMNCFVPVPSYSLEKAERDYILASARYRLRKQVVDVTRGKYRGESFLASRSDVNDDALKKVNELPMFDPNNKQHLQRALCVLADENEELKKRVKELEDENKEVQLARRGNNAAIEEYVKEGKGGLCRLSISSDEYHKKNPNVAKKMFGFADRRKKEDNPLSSWDVTKNFIKVMFGVEHEEPTIENIRDPVSKRNKKFSRFEQVLITLMFFTNVFDYGYISAIFGCDEKLVGRCIKGWAPLFREVGYHMARLPLTKEFLDMTYPTSYHDLNFTHPVATVVDGTDVLMETVRTDRYVNISQASNKVKSSACRGITWSTPMGLVHEFTDPFYDTSFAPILDTPLQPYVISTWCMQ